MKTKSFQQYLEKRLDKSEIAKIEKLAELEMKFLRSLQEDVSNDVLRIIILLTFWVNKNLTFV
jgi:hypothetical protein